MPALEAPSSSSNPAADEELEVVFGRQLLQGPTEEETTPLPQVLVQVRESIMEATSSAKAAFRREWATLESERHRLSYWHTRLEAQTKAEASHAAEARSKLKREEAFALEVVGFTAHRSELETRFAAQQSELETRSQGLEVWKQELDNLSATLPGWREQLQERASKLAVAEAELEEDRKSLDKRESLTANMEKLLGRQRDSLKKLKESVEKRKSHQLR
ncbi:homer protein homolog 1-like [Panicum virgatum]|uniref:homer protein homolog 1-like n=1 Tax=Panicum virgatum TaxID=38727 RepID=UPI0019D55FD9|nr:homer protein homolog 1-like [Panicum virgatum]